MLVKKASSMWRWFIGLVAILLMSVFSIKMAIQHYNSQTLVLEKPFVEISSGESFGKLCKKWQLQGAITSCTPYRIMAKLWPELFSLQAGVYYIKNASVMEALKLIREGRRHQFSITIIAGDNIRDVRAKLSESPYLINDFDELALSQSLSLPNASLEGWLHPETYYYEGHTTASELAARAVKKTQSILNKLWQQRDPELPLMSAYEALILASIIEKETGVAKERALISSVFINRLRINMRLQTDPTVIYGLGEKFDGDIKKADLRNYTPYNTYRINGLTPTPIAMASTEAILAATKPETSEYLYFVAKGNGEHQFSKTLKAHNAAVKKYILKRTNDS